MVFGQAGSFTGESCNTPALNANSLCGPAAGVAVDGADNLYVADSANSRVLIFKTPLINTVADEVLGQAGSFSSGLCNLGGAASRTTLCTPLGVGLDGSDNLYVADTYNSRVLEYDMPLVSDDPADRVFGQGGSFTATACNNGTVSALSLCHPSLEALD